MEITEQKLLDREADLRMKLESAIAGVNAMEGSLREILLLRKVLKTEEVEEEAVEKTDG